MLSKPCQCAKSTHKNHCVFVRGVLCCEKEDCFLRRVEFCNSGGDLIVGLVTGGAGGGGQWLPLGLEDMREETREGDTVLNHSLRERESVESPSNTWGPLLQLQEIKEIFMGGGGRVRSVKTCTTLTYKKFFVKKQTVYLNLEVVYHIFCIVTVCLSFIAVEKMTTKSKHLSVHLSVRPSSNCWMLCLV